MSVRLLERRQAAVAGAFPPRPRRRQAAPPVLASHTHYDTLGVPHTAGREDIKRAYRRLARQLHPDVNRAKGAGQRFQEVLVAFEVLSDELRRAEYDAARRTWRGNTRGGASLRPGRHVRAALSLTLEQAVFGGPQLVSADLLCVCADCQGSGEQPGAGADERCGMCRGRGEVQVTRGGGTATQRLGRLSMLQPCPACAGRGFPASRACRACTGAGLARQRQAVRVVVPQGVESGSVVRVPGQGDLGCPPGDLLLTVEVAEHQSIRRQGQDLCSQLAVPLWDALLGTTATVSTLYGPATLTIPPGTQHGAVLSVAAAGVRRAGGAEHERGAHLFEVHVRLPAGPPGEVGEEERVLLEQLAALQRKKARQRTGEGRSKHTGTSVQSAVLAGPES